MKTTDIIIPTNKIKDMKVWRGARVPKYPEITVIVMSTHSDLRSYDAAISVLDNSSVPTEILVVNTGRGSLRERMKNIESEICLIETKNHQYAGGTRNIGIKYAGAPIISFLAADCKITKGWVENRLRYHEKNITVSSALLPSPNKYGYTSSCSYASCIVTHGFRLPIENPHKTHLYGLSYNRMVFDEIGLFNEDVEVGEDTILNRKIPEAYGVPLWASDIITLHEYPNRLLDSLKDQYLRGKRESSFQRENGIVGLSVFVFRSFNSKLRLIALVLLKREYRFERKLTVAVISILLLLARTFGNIFYK